ncbi:hypothetical protein [Agrococcus carbonis]|uniref:hypothetical protein n=1 Tax=Agrococcus carbonis TaxID=684552 RepID=UPI0012FAD7CF|nr:hypothetical protein [Agrococcus carbonis]
MTCWLPDRTPLPPPLCVVVGAAVVEPVGCVPVVTVGDDVAVADPVEPTLVASPVDVGVDVVVDVGAAVVVTGADSASGPAAGAVADSVTGAAGAGAGASGAAG